MSATHDDQDENELAHEGVEAFNAMTAAMHGLNARMAALDAGLGAKLAGAERAVTGAEAAARSAREAAEHAAALARAGARSAAAWAALGALGAALAAGGAGYRLGHTSGRETGLADGYRAAVDQNAAASWANTPSGQLALALDRAGSLAVLAACNAPGWKPDTRQGRRVCFPAPDRDGSTHGWVLP